MTPREQFLAVVGNVPLLRGDAIVLLAGEDASARVEVTIELLRQQAAPHIVITGALHKPPHLKDATTLSMELVGRGVSPDRITVDEVATNTREQAVNVVAMAVEQGWKRLLIAASPYHAYRAFLTFLKAVQEQRLEDELHLIVIPAAQSPWFGCPAGMRETRAELLGKELSKVDAYGEHVAGYADALAYLERWERRRDAA